MSEPAASSEVASDGVVLLHGISRTARSFRKMQTALEGCGYATLNIDSGLGMATVAAAFVEWIINGIAIGLVYKPRRV